MGYEDVGLYEHEATKELAVILHSLVKDMVELELSFDKIRLFNTDTGGQGILYRPYHNLLCLWVEEPHIGSIEGAVDIGRLQGIINCLLVLNVEIISIWLSLISCNA